MTSYYIPTRRTSESLLRGRVARFFLVKHTKFGKWSQNRPTGHNIHKSKYHKIPNGYKIHITIFSIPKPSKIFPNLGIYTIWQPCVGGTMGRQTKMAWTNGPEHTEKPSRVAKLYICIRKIPLWFFGGPWEWIVFVNLFLINCPMIRNNESHRYYWKCIVWYISQPMSKFCSKLVVLVVCMLHQELCGNPGSQRPGKGCVMVRRKGGGAPICSAISDRQQKYAKTTGCLLIVREM
jgi:hypothetical protein